MKDREKDGGVPDWAWKITWTIMGLGVVLNLIGLLALLLQ